MLECNNGGQAILTVVTGLQIMVAYFHYAAKGAEIFGQQSATVLSVKGDCVRVRMGYVLRLPS